MPATYFWITFCSCNLLKEQGSIDCNSNTHLQHMGVAEIKCYDNAQLDANYQKKNFFKHHRVGIFTHYNLKRWYNSFKLDSVKKHLVSKVNFSLWFRKNTTSISILFHEISVKSLSTGKYKLWEQYIIL